MKLSNFRASQGKIDLKPFRAGWLVYQLQRARYSYFDTLILVPFLTFKNVEPLLLVHEVKKKKKSLMSRRKKNTFIIFGQISNQ